MSDETMLLLFDVAEKIWCSRHPGLGSVDNYFGKGRRPVSPFSRSNLTWSSTDQVR